MYHLTARNVVGGRFSARDLRGASTALLGFCPTPAIVSRYEADAVAEQWFIHVAPESVRLLSVNGRPVVSLSHIYGGPVASATMEELAYYGVRTVLAYGLAGSLDQRIPLGTFYMVEDAYAADGTTRHYTDADYVPASPSLVQRVADLWPEAHRAPLKRVRAATGDAIYREDDRLLSSFRARGCHIVNLDSSHLYATAQANGENARLQVVQCGVVSDVVPGDGESSQTALGAMLATEAVTGFNPMAEVDRIVAFYLDMLLPTLGERAP